MNVQKLSKNLILTLTLILTLSTVNGGQRKFQIAFFIPGNGSTQYLVVEAPDAGTAQQFFKAAYPNLKYSSYTEIK